MKKLRLPLLASLICNAGFADSTNLSADRANEIEQNLCLVHKILEYGDIRAVAHLDEFFAQKVRVHHSLSGEEGEDLDLATITEKESSRIASLLGKEWKLLHTFVSEDCIVAYLQMRGVHVGEFMGLPASGIEFNIPVILIYRFQNGKICEVWNSYDRLALLQQIGEVHVCAKKEK